VISGFQRAVDAAPSPTCLLQTWLTLTLVLAYH
jgi:hypothetical protein